MASRKNGLVTTKGSPHNPSDKLDAKARSRFGLEVQERIMNDIALGFRNADGEMLNELVHCLDFMNGLPFFKAYKARTWETFKIRSGQKILDVACGIGFDVIEMAKRYPSAKFVGVDISEGFLEIAKSRAGNLANVKFLQGNSDGVPLPLPENEFDGVRIDRSLQHMKDPHSAIKEMVRVTRPGGHIVAAEPDWGTFILYNGDLDVGTTLAKQFKGSIRNPYVGRELGMLFTECGVVNPQCDIHAFCTADFKCATVVFDLARVRDRCIKLGILTSEDARRWWLASEEASERGIFFASRSIP